MYIYSNPSTVVSTFVNVSRCPTCAGPMRVSWQLGHVFQEACCRYMRLILLYRVELYSESIMIITVPTSAAWNAP